MTHSLPLANNKVIRSMRSVKQNVSASYLDGAKNKSPYICEVPFEVLESELMNLALNKLNKKEMKAFSQKQTFRSITRHLHEVLTT
tara:strand:+ start:2614 stop:2871 length:258 start_codon:yes stop_codon:yes gene_type:complete